jgi:hypothetical protein
LSDYYLQSGSKVYRAACKKCCNISANQSRARKPEKYRQTNLAYYYKNKDALNEYRRAKWPEVYEQTAEHRLAQQRQHRKENPEKVRAFARKRRARKKENGFEKYTEAQVLGLHGPTCHLCQKPIDLSLPRKIGVEGWRDSLQIDHVMPIAKGGPDTLANVKPSHARCNIGKRDRLPS